MPPVEPPAERTARRTLRPTSRGKIIGRSEVMRRVIATVDRIAKTDCNVLITGESGTGKESLVGALHDASGRADAPLVTVNCGALPETLIESELFGHAKGAFTGASATRPGRVAQAEGGTLFLDEVAELPPAVQATLLRLLQQHEYTPVGDDRTVTADVRIVAATHRDLAEGVAEGSFREDLFYRLNVIELHLPPLRDRPEDIELLVAHFYEQAVTMSGREDLAGIEDDAVEALRDHHWPGNIRELENVVQRIALLAPGPQVTAEDIPAQLRRGPPKRDEPTTQLPDQGINLRDVIEQYERQLVQQALERTKGNKKQAAKLLGMNRTTLVQMVKRKNIDTS